MLAEATRSWPKRRLAAELLGSEGVVLLSPGRRAFGAYRDYAERGRHFAEPAGFDPDPISRHPRDRRRLARPGRRRRGDICLSSASSYPEIPMRMRSCVCRCFLSDGLVAIAAPRADKSAGPRRQDLSTVTWSTTMPARPRARAC